EEQAGVVDEVFRLLPGLVGAAGDGGGARRGGVGGGAGGTPGAGDHIPVVGGAKAGGVFEAQAIAELVTGPEGEHFHLRLEEILVLQVDGNAVVGGAAGADVGAEVRFVLGVEVVVIGVQVQPVSGLPDGGEGRALALFGGRVAVGNVLVGEQQVGAHRKVVVDALVAVEAVALVSVGAEADLRPVEIVLGAGPLGDAVHPAAGGAAPGEGGAG